MRAACCGCRLLAAGLVLASNRRAPPRLALRPPAFYHALRSDRSCGRPADRRDRLQEHHCPAAARHAAAAEMSCLLCFRASVPALS